MLFAKRAAIFYQRSAIRRNAPLFHGESAAWIAALYKMAHFQELRHTQRNRHNTRYAAIISAAAARFFCILFDVHIPYMHRTCIHEALRIF